MSTLPQNFKAFNLSSSLISALQDRQISQPTAIQSLAIPAILAGQDVQGKAPTGSGKTIAFGLPLLESILQGRLKPLPVQTGNQIQTLILVPTRELAVQVAETLSNLANAILPRVKVVAVYGGVNITPQMLVLRGGADILVSTPGRLMDLVQHNAVKFAQLKTLVLDEADRLLQLGFCEAIQAVVKLLPSKRQTLLFSATFPAELSALMANFLVAPVWLEATQADAAEIQQRAIKVLPEAKNAALIQVIQQANCSQVLVFANAKNTCNRLVLKLAKAGIQAKAFHSDKTQAARMQALAEFKAGQLAVLIATDVAARGIDITALPLVINFDLPRAANDYVHRIGRTGRAGQAGQAVSLLCEADYAHFRLIEKRIKMRLTWEE